MSVVKMSNEAYTEFKSFLQENGVEKFMSNCPLQGKMLNCWDLRGKRGGES